LRGEDWSSLTNHVTELFVLDRFGYLKCQSAASVVDGIIPQDGQQDISFDPNDRKFLMARGIQVKGRRHVRGKAYGTTGDIKLSSPFKYLFIVWVDDSYAVEPGEVFRLTYSQVKRLIDRKCTTRPEGKNNYKITHVEARHIGAAVPLADENAV